MRHQPIRGSAAFKFVPGKWSAVERGELFTCPECCKEVVGTIGPKGGKTWAWALPDGTRLCSKGCAAIRHDRDAIDNADDDMKVDTWLRDNPEL